MNEIVCSDACETKRAVLVVLDGIGIGFLPDADEYGDRGAHTLKNTSQAVGGLRVPHLERFGLGCIDTIEGVECREEVEAAYGKMAELSRGKDTTTGHWELAGLVTEEPFPTYPDGFPKEIIDSFKAAIGRNILGNRPASGTEIIEDLGEKHLESGFPIIYTSVDSVFQIAAHKQVIPVEKLYEYCRIARRLLRGEHAVARVIARPFTGRPGNFTRTAERKDFSVPPPESTVLDAILDSGREVIGIGKIASIFANRGVTDSYPTGSNLEGLERTHEILLTNEDSGLIFVNLVDFDTKYGHRNDPGGMARALSEFDTYIPRICSALGAGDLLLITADHGCDPTFPGTDHTREYVPLLAWGPAFKGNIDLGSRGSFCDIAATLSSFFGIKGTGRGTSFLTDL